jgi:hypothetical protein
MQRSIAIAPLLVVLCAWAVLGKPNRDGIRVVVYVDPGSVRVSGTEMILARLQAAQLFAAAGIRLEWRDGEPKPDANGARVVGIQFVETTPVAFHAKLDEGAMAFARLYGAGPSSITVLGDRVRSVLQPYTEVQAGKLLGHILAHELCHVLEGGPRHSQTGLMKPFWTILDYGEMISTGLPFAPEDVELMRAAVGKPHLSRPRGAGWNPAAEWNSAFASSHHRRSPFRDPRQPACVRFSNSFWSLEHDGQSSIQPRC